ncbi:MAG: hypothetical protein MZU97_18500 [Bacillus subtilis]|nr:hypothetical protein [Bacillus subtilis]
MNWDLSYLFPTLDAFEEAYQRTLVVIKQLASFKGQLSDETKFVAYFNLQKEIQTKGLRAYQYANLLSDLNKKNMENAARLQKVQIAMSTLSQACSFEEPELISLGKDTVLRFVDNHPELAEYRFGFEKLFRRQEHILDDKKRGTARQFQSIDPRRARPV